MSAIFISYRRNDGAATSGRVYDRLAVEFGRLLVFRDVASIPPGADFRRFITQVLQHCLVQLVIIGPQWIGPVDEYGRRRLDDPNDVVRIEIEMAIQRGIAIIPLLVDGARMPRPEEIPTSLRPLLNFNALPVRNDRDFDSDMERVISALSRWIQPNVPLPMQFGTASNQSATPKDPASTPFWNNTVQQVVSPIALPRATNLVGRNLYLDKLMASLRAGEASGIFALHGMGGVGKTAIAAEAVALLASDRQAFPGGAAWISCEGLKGARGLSSLWQRVARMLRLDRIYAIADAETRRVELAAALVQLPRILLALDNIEPELDADLILQTLSVPGHTTVLLTSRQAIAPDRIFTIALPPLERYDAATLISQRLRQVDSSRPSPSESDFIVQLVELLGGLPLAMELVAAYAAVQRMPLNDVFEELKQDKLSAVSLNFEVRRAVRSRFQRSWNVLSLSQRKLFAGLSLIRTVTFPRAAAVALAFAVLSEMESTRRTSFRVTSSEVDQSAQRDVAQLVSYALAEPLMDGRGEQRLRLHPLLREFAAEYLQTFSPQDQERLEFAVIHFWQHYGEQHPNFMGLDALEAESVWEASEESRRHAAATQTTSRDLLTPMAQAEQLRTLGYHMGTHGDPKHGRERLNQSLTISLQLNDIAGMGKCHQYLALLDEGENNYTGAITHYLEALRYFSQINSPDAEVIQAELARIKHKG